MAKKAATNRRCAMIISPDITPCPQNPSTTIVSNALIKLVSLCMKLNTKIYRFFSDTIVCCSSSSANPLSPMKITISFLAFAISMRLMPLQSAVAQHRIENPGIRWKFETQGPIRGSSVIDNDQIFFGSADGHVYALNKSDGKLNWKFETQGAIVAAPAVDGNTVVVSTRDNSVYGIDTRHGTLTWKFQMQDDFPLVYDGGWRYYMAAPVIFNNIVYVGSGDGNLYALNIKNGKQQWRYLTGGRIRASPLVTPISIFLPCNDGVVYVLDSGTGKLRWKFETKGAGITPEPFRADTKSIYTQPILINGVLVFGARDGHVYAIDSEKQRLKWSFSYAPTWAMAVATDGDLVYAGWSTNNIVNAIDLTTGQEQWNFRSGSHTYAMPLVVNTELYVGCADGKLYQLNKTTGEKLWEYKIGSEIFSSPTQDAGTIYFGADDGFFYAIENKQKAFKAVFQPSNIQGRAQYLVLDQRIAPYLKTKGFEQLDTVELQQFMLARIKDRAPSVVVFALPLIPTTTLGEDPSNGTMRKYLESGGRVVWFGDIPNFYALDKSGDFSRNPTDGLKLLDVEFESLSESGNYYSRATQEGLSWGLPDWFKCTGLPVVVTKDITPLSRNEFNGVTAWSKKFGAGSNAAFVSFRPWAWNVPINDHELALIHQVAIHQLDYD